MRQELSGPDDAPRTAGIGEVPALSGLRGVAALWVMIYHCWALAGTPPPVLRLGGLQVDFTLPVSLGWAGVDLFFVLSAFLLALPFAEARAASAPSPSLATYFRRRALRILPAYYVQLAILLFLATAFDVGHGMGAWQLLAHLCVMFYVTSPPVAPLVGVWYTLTPECLYYVVLPLAALWLRPRRWPLLLVLALATSTYYRFWVAQSYGHLSVGERVDLLVQLPARIDQFMIGSLFAYAAVRGALRPGWRSDAATAAALAGVAGLALWLQRDVEAYWQGAPIQFLWHGLYAACAGLVCLAAVRGSGLARALFDRRLLRFFGRISFSVYLWHFPLFQWLAGAAWLRALPGGPAAHLVFVGIPAVVGVAWLSYQLVERPFLRWAHGRSRAAGSAPLQASVS